MEQPLELGPQPWSAAGDVVILSRRGPLAFSQDPHGQLVKREAPGGLVSALAPVARRRRLQWVAAAVSAADRAAAQARSHWLFGLSKVRLVALPVGGDGPGFDNPVLWFLQHGLADRLGRTASPDALRSAWLRYADENQRLAGAAVASAPAAAFVIQDYHLYLAPRLIRRWRPAARIAHFCHIPWPAPSAWAALPPDLVRELLRGLLGADLLGFQTATDVERFLETCRAYLEAVRVRSGGLEVAGRTVSVRAYPITIDSAALLASAQEHAAQPLPDASSVAPEEERSAMGVRGGLKTILRVDRLDPSKNIPAGFRAFGLLLETHPDLRGRVRFRAHLVPSREHLEEYRREKELAHGLAAEVNARFGRPGWQPIEIVQSDDRCLALQELREFDVLLANSLADGMNLVAKEGALLNRRDGVLVLSRQAGAWEELGRWALGVAPESVPETAAALARALQMRRPERHFRLRSMRSAVLGSSVEQWFVSQLRDLDGTPPRVIPPLAADRMARAV